MRQNQSVLLLLVLLATAVRGSLASTPDVVALPHNRGSVRGIVDVADGSRSFRSIPFAKSPAGALRWRPPEPATPWPGEVLDARHAGPSCLQPPGFNPPIFEMSEDCLRLSVYTPLTTAASNHAVLLWVHGGSFTGGGANQTRLDGRYTVSALGDVIVVVLQYRLGAFGFLGSDRLRSRDPHGSTGNYGLLDQRAGLLWVQTNIAAFGGDPDRVLLMGQSAGAASVGAHLVMQRSTGLFSRAGMSSSGFVDWSSSVMAAAEEMYDEVLLRAGCGGANASCLENAPADLIRNISNEIDFRGDPTGDIRSKGLSGNQRWGGTANPAGWGPTVDGVELLLAPERYLAAAANATIDVGLTSLGSVPIMIGWARDEGGGFAGATPVRCLLACRCSFVLSHPIIST